MSEATRHRRRSTRVLLAVAVLILAGLMLAAALAVGSPPALLVAAVASYAAGVVATRMLALELAQSRRDAARDRARQAQADTARASTVAKEQQRLVRVLTDRLRSTSSLATTLRAERDLAREQVGDTSRRLVRESRRTSARIALLQGDIDRLSQELAVFSTEDMLATWDGSDDAPQANDAEQREHAGVVDLMAWEEQRTTPAGTWRKQA